MSRSPALALVLVFAVAACGSKRLPQQSALDTPETHFSRGMVKFERGDLRGAEAEFERSRVLDSDFSPSYAGSGLVAMAQGDFWRARKQIEQALHRDGDVAGTYVALGRILTEEGTERGFPTDDWLDDALTAYKRARKIDPDDPAVDFWEGKSYMRALRLEPARMALTRVIEQNRGRYVERAMAEVERIQIVQRVSPGSDLGIKIAMSTQLTRAELAVLLLEELKLDELIEQRRLSRGGKGSEAVKFRSPQANGVVSAGLSKDIEYSWARAWVEDALSLGIPGLELLPDGTFRPDEPVTRASYARVSEGILSLITADPSLSTRYVGEASRFPDVRGDSYAYNAIAVSVERGIMSADRITGRFRPEDTVSGAEALLMIRELQNAVRMEF